jgi:hypothetical protein
VVEKYRLKHLERVGRVPRNVALFFAWAHTNITYLDDWVYDIKIVSDSGEELAFDSYFDSEPIVGAVRDEDDRELYVISVNELGELILWTFERVEP